DWWRADKFHLPVTRISKPVELPRVCVLALDDSAGSGVRVPIRGRTSAELLLVNTYRPEYLDAAGRRRDHFHDCMRLASETEVEWLRRSPDPRHLPATAAAIVDELRHWGCRDLACS